MRPGLGGAGAAGGMRPRSLGADGSTAAPSAPGHPRPDRRWDRRSDSGSPPLNGRGDAVGQCPVHRVAQHIQPGQGNAVPSARAHVPESTGRNNPNPKWALAPTVMGPQTLDAKVSSKPYAPGTRAL